MHRHVFLVSLATLFLVVWVPPQVSSFCTNFPFGHTCRNIDLTAFCIQTYQLIRIRNHEKPVKPYLELEKIFTKLEKAAKADQPFVHFGGYKQGEAECLIKRDCSGGTTASSVGRAPAPPGNPPGKDPADCPTIEPPPEHCPETKSPPCPKDCECCDPGPPTDPAVGTIFTLQDGCELRYLKAPLDKKKGGSVLTIKPGEKAKENPYMLEVFEVAVQGIRLHNWLHIKISHNGSNPFGDNSELGSGFMKMVFIIAHDATGFPVGEFTNDLPCGATCKCDEKNTPEDKFCHQGTLENHFPCMFDGKRVVTNTGMMMVYADNDSPKKGLKEIHASWHYAQSASPESFITELHFKALVVDDFEEYSMPVEDTNKNVRLSGISERRVKKEGIFGWNPQYDILHPTPNTVGAWDFFRGDVYNAKDVDCHMPISPTHYVVEPYPDSGEEIRKVMEVEGKEKEHCYRLNDTFRTNLPLENMQYCLPKGTPAGAAQRSPMKCPGFGRSRVEPWFFDAYGFINATNKIDREQMYPWTHFGARTEAYAIRDGGVSADSWRKFQNDPASVKLYWGIEPEGDANALDYAECEGKKSDRYGIAHQHSYPTYSQNYDIQGKYGHFCTDGSGRRVLNFDPPTSKWPNTLSVLWKLPPVADVSYFDDRCYCPAVPTTPDPRYIAPPKIQIQGRRQHAYQMIIAWNCIVPFAIFVSRYYKETFSKVFFLQEYWWYTMHVLCMGSAAMFTFGGIYVMELKRKHPINWEDPNITIHIVMGYIIIILFFFQVFSGFFRVRDVKKRLFNIFMHWFMGVLEYILAVACMINAGFILLAGMTCAGVVALVLLLVFQVMFYASMEVHMRNVDRVLKLNPPRSYLPPPVMRVFHKDAPDSKFRIYVLLAYAGLCSITSLIQYVSMNSNREGESCFLKSKEYQRSSEGLGVMA